MKKLEQILLEGIEALIPLYRENIGDTSKIIKKDGTIYLENRKVKAVLNNLAKIYSIDLISVRRKYATVVNQRNILPIPFSKDITLIPFKMRVPIFPSDGSQGYINLESIKSINEIDSGKNVEICTVNNQKITCLTSLATANKRISYAKIVKYYYINLHSDSSRLPQQLESLYLNYNEPATKADVALLNSQIAEIKTLIKTYVMK